MLEKGGGLAGLVKAAAKGTHALHECFNKMIDHSDIAAAVQHKQTRLSKQVCDVAASASASTDLLPLKELALTLFARSLATSRVGKFIAKYDGLLGLSRQSAAIQGSVALLFQRSKLAWPLHRIGGTNIHVHMAHT